MSFIQYQEINLGDRSLEVIRQANVIISEYRAAGFTLTLRQLYYQFVARDMLPNSQQSYKRLGDIISKARLAGEVSWDAIEDRTRSLRSEPHWDTPRDLLNDARHWFQVDMWDNQFYRPEVWIEKDALIGVIEEVCRSNDVPYFACRGYSSQSEQWRAGRRFKDHLARGQTPIVLHLGDHDPSGVDMTRDNEDRLTMFAQDDIEVRRLALNFDQVRRYNPPPNPTKFTDSRAAGYTARFGHSCWELDALDPKVIAALITDALADLRDDEAWAAKEREQAEGVQTINELIDTL